MTTRPTRRDIERMARALAATNSLTVEGLATKARVPYARAWSVVTGMRSRGEVQVVATERPRPGRPRLVLGKVPTMTVSCLEAWRMLRNGLYVELGAPEQVVVLASMPTPGPRWWGSMARYARAGHEDPHDSYSLALDPVGDLVLLVGIGHSRGK